MATARERLELLITGDARDAVMAMRQAASAAGALDNGVAGATTQMSKMRAMAGAVGSHVQQNIGMYSVAAVGALTTAAIASIKQFTDLADMVRDFGRASGLGAQQSSRLVAVFDDLKISQQAADTGFFRLNRGIASGTVDLSKYGAEVVRTTDGNLDMYRTLLSISDAYTSTTDSGARAQMVQEAFGRGGMALIPILEQGRKGIQEMYDAVPGRQILKDEDLMAARRYELALDDLNDSVMELKVALGNELVPQLTVLASAMATAIRSTGDLGTKMEGLEFAGTNAADVFGFVRKNVEGAINPIKGITNALESLGVGGGTVDKLTEAQGRYAEAQKRVNELSDEGAQGTKRMRDAKDDLERAEQRVITVTERRTEAQKSAVDKDREALQATYDLVLQKLGLEGAQIALEKSILRLNEVTAESTSTEIDKRDALLNSTQAILNYAKAQVENEQMTLESELGQRRMVEILEYLAGTLDPNSPLVSRLRAYSDELSGIPQDVRTRFSIALDTDEINRQIASLGLSADQARQIFGEGFQVIAGATGAIVNRPTMALIGEAGPEAVIPLSRVPGNQPLPTIGQAAGQSITIPLVVDGKVLAEVTASEFNRPGGPLIRQRVIV